MPINSQDNNIKLLKCKLSSGLYIVATPIGNLKDITIRALETLQSVDIIMCEDSRVTNKLLSHYNIRTSMQVYSDYNAQNMRPKILRYIEQGQAVALVSDAGTPLISDPGYKLVCEAYQLNLPVTTIPGASAIISALTLAGLPTDSFLFAGFLAPKSSARVKILSKFVDAKFTLVFYQRASRIIDSLMDIENTLGNRNISIVREITKCFEEVKKGDVQQLLKYYTQKGNPKGEVVIVIEQAVDIILDDTEIDTILQQYIQDMSLKDAVSKVSKKYNLPRKDVYNRALKLNNNND